MSSINVGEQVSLLLAILDIGKEKWAMRNESFHWARRSQ